MYNKNILKYGNELYYPIQEGIWRTRQGNKLLCSQGTSMVQAESECSIIIHNPEGITFEQILKES